MYQTNEDTLMRIKRLLALIVSLTMAGVSVWFSRNGFGIETKEQVVWIGWFLGATVNVIEMVFNTSIKKLNPTLIGAGILAYIYGTYTNIVGFHGIMDSWAFASVVGILVEFLPEPLFAWAIGVTGGGDVVGNIIELMTGKNIYDGHVRSEPRPSYPHKPQTFPQHNKQHRFPQESLMHDAPIKGDLKSPVFNDKYIKNKIKRSK